MAQNWRKRYQFFANKICPEVHVSLNGISGGRVVKLLIQRETLLLNGLGKEMGDSMRIGLSVLEALVLLLVRIWPLLLIGAGIWIFYRIRKKKRLK